MKLVYIMSILFLFLSSVVLALVPVDPSFSNQWYLENTGQYSGIPGVDIDAVSAWDSTTGNGAVVAVIGDGVGEHTDLNLWLNTGEIPNNLFDDDSNGYVDDVHGFEHVVLGSEPSTAVAGIIAARSNNLADQYTIQDTYFNNKYSFPKVLRGLSKNPDGSFLSVASDGLYSLDSVSGTASIVLPSPSPSIQGVEVVDGETWITDDQTQSLSRISSVYDSVTTDKVRISITDKYDGYFGFAVSISEFEIYDLNNPIPTNLALSATASASGYDQNFLPEYANDGLLNWRWQELTTTNSPSWVELDFPAPITANSFVLHAPTFPLAYSIEYWDGASWLPLFSDVCPAADCGTKTHTLPLVGIGLASSYVVGGSPKGLSYDGVDSLWFTDNASNQVKRFSLLSYQVVDVFNLPAGSWWGLSVPVPSSVLSDYFFVSETDSDEIFVYDRSSGFFIGSFSSRFSNLNPSLDSSAMGLFVDGSYLYQLDKNVADPSSSDVYKDTLSISSSPGGVAGICWSCSVMDVHIANLDDGAEIAEGIQYALDNGADIILLDYARPSSIPAEKAAIQSALDQSIPLVAPAGDRYSTWKHFYPAAYDGVFSVGSSTNTNEISYNSNKGSSSDSWIDLFAPGQSMFVLGADNSYRVLDSSRYSAGVVAGVVALLLADGVPSDEVFDKLIFSAVLPPAIPVGVVNAYGALTTFIQRKVVFKSVFVADQNDHSLNQGESTTLRIETKNYGSDSSSVSSSLLSCGPNISILSGTPTMSFDASDKGFASYQVAVSPTAVKGTQGCIMSLSDGLSYNEFIFFTVEVTDSFVPSLQLTPDNDFFFSNTIPADVNGDGRSDLVLVQKNIDYNGLDKIQIKSQNSVLSELMYNSTFYSLPVLGDLNMDGELELVYLDYDAVSGDVMLRVFSSTTQWNANLKYASSGAAIANLDSDPEQEVVVTYVSDFVDGPFFYLSVFESDGQVKSGFPVVLPDGYALASRVLLMDIDDDGQSEIFFHLMGDLYAYDSSGVPLSGFPVSLGGGYSGYPVQILGYSDGQDDFIVLGIDKYLTVLHENGTLAWSSIACASAFQEDYFSSIAVGNFDADADLEIVSSCTGTNFNPNIEEQYRMKVSVFDNDGTSINSCWDSFEFADIGDISVKVLNLDADPEHEFIMNLNNSFTAYNADCSVVDGFPLFGSANNEFVLSDYVVDGMADIIYSICDFNGYYYSCNSDGRLSAYFLDLPFTPVWPLTRHDIQGTNYFGFTDPVQRCEDGSASGVCSWQQPNKCIGGKLKPACNVCGCPSGQMCGTNNLCSTKPNVQRAFVMDGALRR